MHGQQKRVRVFGGLPRRTGARIALGLASQFLELLIASRVTEDNVIPSSRKDRTQLCAHQSGTQNADFHAAPLLGIRRGISNIVTMLVQRPPFVLYSCGRRVL